MNTGLFVATLVLALSAGGKPMTTSHAKEIQVALAEPKAVLGAPIMLKTTYANRATQKLSFREPAKTWEVMLAIKWPDGSEQSAHFGRIFRRDVGGISRQVVEDADDIELAPGAKHEFSEDLWQRWPALVRPGRSTLRVVDRSSDAETVTSNAVELFVTFTGDSATRLIELARDEKAPTESRQVAADWLAKIRRGFKLTLENPTPDQVRANQAALEELAAWWEANKGSKGVADAIAGINRG